MRLGRLGSLSFVSILFVFLCGVSTPTLRTSVAANPSGQAQQSQNSKARPSPPATPPPPLADQQQFVPYWTTEAGWDTEIELRNNQASGSLMVTPALRSADGTEVPLQPVLVQPHEVKIIDLAAATGAAPMLGRYGSAALRYRAPDGNSLFAMAMVLAVGHPFAFHIDPYSQFSGYKAGSREGIWWLPKNTTTGYLIVTNASDKPVETILSLYDPTGRAMRQKVTLAAASTNRYSIRQLVTEGGLSGPYGGISVFAAQHADSVGTVGLLFDDSTGFSALLKMYDHDPSARIAERDYAKTGVWTLRAPMLALANPDPALGFPLGTKLDPQLLIRNTTAQPVAVSLSFHYWQGGGSTGQAAGPSLALRPNETRRVDVGALEAANVIPVDAHWASVTMTTNGPPDAVMAMASSYDSNLRYGAQTPFSDQLAFHWAGSLWQYDAHHDSILTVGNGGTKPAQALLTLYYNQGAGKYQMKRTLEPGDQMWVDVGDLVREHAPDINGSFLPADVTSGSYSIRELGTGVGSLFEGKVVYDKTYGEVTYGCAACCAYKAAMIRLLYNPLGIPYGQQAGQGIEAWDTCSDLWEDITLDFFGTWATGNTGIATVDAAGTHTGVSPGSTTTYTGPTDEQVQTLWNKCPIQPVGPQGGDNVIELVLQGNAYASIFVGTDPNLAAANSIFATVSPTGGTFTEASSASGDTFTNVASGGPGWVVHTTTQSASTGDRTITVTYAVSGEGQVSRSLQVTARQFAYATNNSPGNTCLLGYGYLYQYVYTPYTHPDKTAVQAGIGVDGTAVVESFNPQLPSGWVTSNGSLNGNSQIVDYVGVCSSSPLSIPTTTTTQTISIEGYQVRQNSLTFSDSGLTYSSNGPTQ